MFTKDEEKFEIMKKVSHESECIISFNNEMLEKIKSKVFIIIILD
jgi:hypothetical protein